MQLRRKFLKKGLLYVILDKEVIDRYKLNITQLADKLAGSGVDLFQFRFKKTPDGEALEIGKDLAQLIHRRRKIFIVNDRVDIACLCGADGLHLGKDDIPVSQARKIIGKNKIIGKTVHSEKDFFDFLKEDTDYLSVGPVFKTRLKPDLTPLDIGFLKKAIPKTLKPIFVIGGISLNNLDSLYRKGLTNIAVCRGIILTKNVCHSAELFKKCLEKVS